MRLPSASIRSFFSFSSAKNQATSNTTVTMARGSRQNGKTAHTPSASSQSSPSDIEMPIPSSIDPVSQGFIDTGSQSSVLIASEPFVLHTLESSASASPENMKSSLLNSKDVQGLAISSSSDGEKPSGQAAGDRQFSAESNKWSKRKAKKANAQGQGSKVPAVSPEILPLGYCGPMPAPPTISSKPNVGSLSISLPLAYAEPTNAERNLRQENEKLREELEEANRLAKGLQESHLRLEEEIEAWKQKCKGFSDVVTDLRNDVEGMINSRLSSFFDRMEEGKEKAGGDKEEKKEEGGEKRRNEKERRWKEGEAEEGKEKKRKEEELRQKIGNEGARNEGRGKVAEAKLKANQEKSQKSCFDQIKAYRQREKVKERRRKKWWNRFRINTSRISLRRVLIKLFFLGLFILVIAPIFLIGIAEIRAYNRAHARRIARLKLKESRNVQLAKAVTQFVADLSPEPIRGTLYHWFLNDGWNLDDAYW